MSTADFAPNLAEAGPAGGMAGFWLFTDSYHYFRDPQTDQLEPAISSISCATSSAR